MREYRVYMMEAATYDRYMMGYNDRCATMAVTYTAESKEQAVKMAEKEYDGPWTVHYVEDAKEADAKREAEKKAREQREAKNAKAREKARAKREKEKAEKMAAMGMDEAQYKEYNKAKAMAARYEAEAKAMEEQMAQMMARKAYVEERAKEMRAKAEAMAKA